MYGSQFSIFILLFEKTDPNLSHYSLITSTLIHLDNSYQLNPRMALVFVVTDFDTFMTMNCSIEKDSFLKIHQIFIFVLKLHKSE